MHPSRFEQATFCFGGKRSIQLSYGCTRDSIAQAYYPRMLPFWSQAARNAPERWLSGRKQRFAKPS